MSSPRKTPSQQRSHLTDETILDAAAQVFEQEGMSATTNGVADRAGGEAAVEGAVHAGPISTVVRCWSV